MSIRTASLALVLALASPAAFAEPQKPVAAQVDQKATPARADQQQEANYAQREQQDKKQPRSVADYEGGQVVIYISGVALVGIILLLILL